MVMCEESPCARCNCENVKLCDGCLAFAAYMRRIQKQEGKDRKW